MEDVLFKLKSFKAFKAVKNNLLNSNDDLSLIETYFY